MHRNDSCSLKVREHSNVCWYGQRGASGHSVDHQFGRKLRRAKSHCSRGLVVKIVRYKNIELTLTTRQLHSRELCPAAALPSTRPTQRKVVHNAATKQTSCPRACRIPLARRQRSPLFCVLVLSETGERKTQTSHHARTAARACFRSSVSCGEDAWQVDERITKTYF